MTPSPMPDKASTLRAKALEHFNLVVERPSLFSLTQEDAERHKHLGLQAVEASLALEPGQLLDWNTSLGGGTLSDSDKRLLALALPFLVGPLSLLDWEFTHPKVGRLPYSAVQSLMTVGETFTYEGVALTKDTVLVQWRRSPV